MKRKILFFVTLLTILGLITIQSCKKVAPVATGERLAAMPAEPVPAVNAVIPFTGTGQTINLTWAGTATDAILWDVYFGTSASPKLAASGVTSNSYTATITKGGVYNWQVSTTDAFNVTTTSPVWTFDVNSNPNVPTSPIPTLNKTGVSCTPTIRWAASDPENDALTYDLLLDVAATPTAVAASGLTDTSYVVTSALTPFTVYYWQVVVHDPYGGQSVGPVWKFTTGALPASAFTGNYNAAEPAEAYSYGVSFAMVTPSTIKTTNYWNSGWTAVFTLDFTHLTYTLPLTTFATGWTGVESGVIEPATGTMVGTYTIWQNGVVAEQGVHTYTHLK
jgi:hypothetical protein